MPFPFSIIVGVSAQIGGAILVNEDSAGRCVLADQIIYATGLAMPIGFVPGAANCGNVGEPRDFRGELFHLLAIAELPRMAGAFYRKKSVRDWGPLRIAVKRADITDKASDAGNRREQQSGSCARSSYQV